jgi:hypothetical protein
MTKFIPKNLNSGFADVDSLNENFSDLATFSDTVLSRDGTSPNTMLSSLDMNSNRIFNLPDAVTPSEPLTLSQASNLTGASGFVSTVTEKQTATAGQTVFTLAVAFYTPGVDNISVYRNGSHISSDEYVQTATNTVTVNTPAIVGDEYVFVVNQRNVSADTFPASSVTYTPVVSGINTNIAAFLDANGLINVKHFGAKGDGVTDDTAAIQAAIDSTLSSGISEGYGGRGSTVFLPDGDYRVSSTINIPQSTTTVFLPDGDYRVSSTINIPQSTTVRGTGIFSCRIRATDTFTDPYVVNLGDGRDGASTGIAMFGSRLEYMTIDAADQPVISIFSRYINENSGLFNVGARRSTTKQIHIDSTLGSPIAQNYFMHNVLVANSKDADANTIGVHIEGNGGTIKGLDNITVTQNTGASGTQLGRGIVLDQCPAAQVSRIHVERVKTAGVELINSSGIQLTGISAFGDATIGTDDVIKVDALSQNFQITAVRAQGNFTNLLAHAATGGKTITDGSMGLYSWGKGDGTNNNLVTTVSDQTNFFRSVDVSGDITANDLSIGDGVELTIAAGAITATSSYHVVDTEADAAADDLDIISGAVDTRLLILTTADPARVVTIKDSTGNLRLAGDLIMKSNRDSITLFKVDGVWVEIARSDNA